MNYIRGGIADRRGVQSENNVLAAFQRRDDVVAVRKTKKWSSEDMDGVDVVADVVQRDSNANVVKVVTVEGQVKSRDGALRSFVSKKANKWGISPEQVENKIMMFNGQKPHAVIDNAIEQQFKSRGIIGPERPFENLKPGESKQIFPDPQELKRAT